MKNQIVGLHFLRSLTPALAVAALAFAFAARAPAQTIFTNVPITGLPQVFESSVAWGDYDNDGRLDFLLTGIDVFGPRSQLWRNTGGGFTNVTDNAAPGLPQRGYGSVAWGDYDNDGRLDFLLTGDGSSRISQLWRNTGGGFTNVTASVFPANSLPGVFYSSVEWGDYDNDGRLDFLLTGSGSATVSQLWRNTGSGFTNVTASAFPTNSLAGVRDGSVAWGDYDNDGRLDFLLTGTTTGGSSGSLSQLWRNTGSGFSNVTDSVTPGLPQVFFSSVAWGDYDNDGRLDFLLAGTTTYDGSGSLSQLWRNMGSGFSNVTDSVTPALPQVFFSSVAWGDYDNDGKLDFLLTGTTNGSTGLSQLWRNTGGGFTNVPIASLLGVGASSVAWGDYDNDGRLDFLLTGSIATPPYSFSQLWRNNTSITNASPGVPTGLTLTATTNAVMLSWNSAPDDYTPSSGLTYNVRAGFTPGGLDLFAGHVDATNGFRRVPAIGNAYLRHSLPLSGLTNGQTVFWSVQAVDTSFAGGPFAAETSVVTIPTLAISSGAETNALVSWTPPTWGWRLQERTNLSVGAWSNSSSVELNPVTVPISNDAKFYRLTPK